MAVKPDCLKLDSYRKQLVNAAGAHSAAKAKAFREERAMADKPEFVDLIREATRQTRRRLAPRVEKPEAKEKSRLSHWPPHRWVQWRMEKFTPWKLKPWD
jgi:hypothetical protein